MKFIVHTLVDITETRARRGEESFLLQQQQNYLTFLQTLGLRVNLSEIVAPTMSEILIKDYGFGSNHKDKQHMWTFKFTVEYADALDTAMLEDDFDLVPVITGLSETAELKQAAFRTKDTRERNILFLLADA
jgi:hypothetical protein